MLLAGAVVRSRTFLTLLDVIYSLDDARGSYIVNMCIIERKALRIFGLYQITDTAVSLLSP